MARGSAAWTTKYYGKPCIPDDHVQLEWYPGVTTTIHRGTERIWQAMGAIMLAYGYRVPTSYTGSYNCRPITGGGSISRHSWPTAKDINAKTNPYKRTPTLRKILWGIDTDMPAAMVREIEAITAEGVKALTWGGRWRTVKDAMHYQLRVSPAEIAGTVHAPRGFYTGGGAPPGGDDEVSLKRGSSGPAVVKIQRGLNAWNPSLALDDDGVYGPVTEAGVKDYQTAAQILSDVTPGECDGVTTAFILEYVADRVGGQPGEVPDHGHDAIVTEVTTVQIGSPS